MKRLLAIFVVALFLTACPVSEVTKVGNPNLDETQDLTQVGTPTTPSSETVTQVGTDTLPGGTEGVTQIGTDTVPGGGEGGIGGGEGGGGTTPPSGWEKPDLGGLVADHPIWTGLNCELVFNNIEKRVAIKSPDCIPTTSSFRINRDDSIESQPDSKTGCRVKVRPREENGEIRIDIVNSEGTTVCSTMPAGMQQKLKDSSPTKQFDKINKDLPKGQSN